MCIYIIFIIILLIYMWDFNSIIRARVAQWVKWIRWLDYLTTHTSLSPIWRGFVLSFVNYKKRCSRVYQLLAHGWWFYPGTPASSITKTGRHDIAEILLKVALNTINQIKSILLYMYFHMTPVTSGSFVLHINHQNGFFWVIQQSV